MQMNRLDHSGFSMLELLIAMVIMGIIVTGTMSMMQRQERAFAQGSARMDALQNHRFAAELLDRNLRVAGANTAPGQPFIVYADSVTISINGDYLTNDPNDMFAVYRNPAATNREVGALTPNRQIRFPGTSFTYPAVAYESGGINSPAETITFSFRPDSTSSHPDRFLLLRQVNDLEPEVVARGIERTPGEPFLSYQELLSGDTIVPHLQAVPASALPLRHSVPLHLSVADTGAAARIDRIRTVQVAFTSVAGAGARRQSTAMRRLIRMPNAGQRAIRTCGETPIAVTGLTAAQVPGDVRITLSWSASFDEASGERDIIRYVIFRRQLPVTSWGEPYFSIPAGRPSYMYEDARVSAGESYQYGVAAQDCTPMMSDLVTSATVTVSP